MTDTADIESGTSEPICYICGLGKHVHNILKAEDHKQSEEEFVPAAERA